jgi:methylamine---glutamate N-methyltransferase subunit B
VVEIDCAGQTTRQINLAIRAALGEGEPGVVRHPASRHNLGVGLNAPGRVIFDGNVGYYCAGMLQHADVEIRGNCGWSVGECTLSGSIVVGGNASAAAGAAIRGGTLVIHGNAGPRTGISQKGGTIVVGGNVGYMAGFIMQKGVLVVCGDTGEALGDSLYEGRIYVGGRIGELGNDAIASELTDDDAAFLAEILDRYQIGRAPSPRRFTKVVSGRRLYNFDKKDFELWRVAL